MKTALFCFGKFHFLLAVWDMLKQKHFRYPGFGWFGGQYCLPDIEVFLHSISISTQPNNLHTTV